MRVSARKARKLRSSSGVKPLVVISGDCKQRERKTDNGLKQIQTDQEFSSSSAFFVSDPFQSVP
jgi:hypothetical protein